MVDAENGKKERKWNERKKGSSSLDVHSRSVDGRMESCRNEREKEKLGSILEDKKINRQKRERDRNNNYKMPLQREIERKIESFTAVAFE